MGGCHKAARTLVILSSVMHSEAMLKHSSEVFAEVRPMLFSIAYRMLGSVMDAEDLVQKAYLCWQRASNADVRSPRAYLATMVTRLCINQLRSARVQREAYVGPWLRPSGITTLVW